MVGTHTCVPSPRSAHATPCPTEAGAISGKGRARPGNSKMDQRGPWVVEDTRELVSQAGGATWGVGLAEACCATACPVGWGSGSRRLCSRCLSLAAGLCPPPSFGFSRGWGLRWASTEWCIHPDAAAVPQHCSSKCSQPPPAPVGTRPLPGTMIYSCLLKDEYHMGLIIRWISAHLNDCTARMGPREAPGLGTGYLTPEASWECCLWTSPDSQVLRHTSAPP